MGSSVYGSIVVNTFTDSNDFSKSFFTTFPDTAPDTATTLRFIQQDNQTITFPNLNGSSDDLVYTGTSGLAQFLQGVTISNSSITSLVTDLSVPNGGTNLSSVAVNQVMVGTGASITFVTMTNGTVLRGTAGVPAVASFTGSSSASVNSASGIKMGMGIVPLYSKNNFGVAFNSDSPVELLTFTGFTYTLGPSSSLSGSNIVIAANTLQAGDIINVNIAGIATNTSAVSEQLTLDLGLGGTFFYTMPNTSVPITAGMYFELEAQFAIGTSGLTTAYATFVLFTGTSSSVRATTSVSPVASSISLSSALAINLVATVSSTDLSIFPDLCNVYVTKTTLSF